MLYEFIVNAARDADPLKDGYQVSGVYFVLCLFVPKAMGMLGAAVGYVAEKIVRIDNINE